MGNRAVITDKDRKVGIYLHWCGERRCVEALLKYCSINPAGGFGSDSEYAMGQFIQVARNAIGNSVGVTTTCDTLYGDDNGLYIVQGWEIVEHLVWDYDKECEVPKSDTKISDDYLLDLLYDINDSQPSDRKIDGLTLRKAITGENQEQDQEQNQNQA